MDMRRSHVPAFGSWDCVEALPYTQCFESARQAGLLRCSYPGDRDLYVAGDFYETDVLSPAMIVVPRRRGKVRYQNAKDGGGGGGQQGWAVKEPPSPLPSPPGKAPKAVDEDLYKISPALLHPHVGKKRGWSFFSSCLLPGCAS
ncbi:uncharacterized protein LOC127797741 isoform X2 [Diospyros lotus]|uniref:uncharacterized protein LOC127797741 isoform X2 n=1 Tax=Diospyros lotus TaxID=55363 RepID=UPI00224FFDE3|nr:uncharacterized protein LOC127797741 isoform X2 [Diospyros lotus]